MLTMVQRRTTGRKGTKTLRRARTRLDADRIEHG
jgi:hypothetical protein